MAIDRGTLDQVRHLLRPFATQLRNTVARAVVQLVDDGKKLQMLQVGVLDEEDVDDAEHHQSYGFSSVPLPGAEAVAVFPSGDRGHPLVVAVSDRRHRPTGGEPGEVTVYSHTGAKVRLLANGDLEITPGGSGVVKVGGASAAQVPSLVAELADLKARIAAWVPVAMDGGASLKAVVAAWPVTGATKVKVL